MNGSPKPKRELGEPVTDPALGIPVGPTGDGTPRHRLVAIGDSLTHGFQSGAIFNTDLSYPAIIAWEMGWYDQFRRPSYPGVGGLPLNIELLIREMEREFGERLDWYEVGLALFRVRDFMSRLEDWWERGPGAHPPNLNQVHHNLAVYGWDLRDVLDRTFRVCEDAIAAPKDNVFAQLVENANERAALRVLPRHQPDWTVLDAAASLGAEGALEGGAGDGIETLIVMLGANNALGAVLSLKVLWSDAGFDNLEKKKQFTVWKPEHFRKELALVAQKVGQIRARHVIWATVPHVTIAPVTRGVANKVRLGSRYFPFYTRPWIADKDFDSKDDPCITENEARDIDTAIDHYNQAIIETVEQARAAGKNWYLFDLAALLDRLAARRYILDPLARPTWWTRYDLPAELEALKPPPDSRFFTSDANGRISGGLFSLDGVHPTTVAYGIIAQELINVMQSAGVKFYLGDGQTERARQVRVDFRRLIALDTLISDPPRSVKSDLHLIGWVDEKLDVFRRMLSHAGGIAPRAAGAGTSGGG